MDLCGGSGAWSKPYRENFDVVVATLPEYDVLQTEITQENIGWATPGHYISCKDIYGILAAPPCTEFSVAKGNRPRNLPDAMEIVKACMQIIWNCRLYGNLKFWALENPRGLLRQFLGVPHYTFEQWQFGGDMIKATDLWGYFNEPTSTVKDRPEDMTVGYPNGAANARGWTKVKYPPEYEAYISQFKGDAKRAACRAITPAGFSEAFYRANS